jgi:integrase
MEIYKGETEKKRLLLKPTNKEGLRVGMRKDGKPYSVRDDRSRYFFPNEWINFFISLKGNQKPIFSFLINTGARIEEALRVKPKNFDWDRNNLTLRVTKIRAKKGERVGKPRTFTISSQFARRMRAYIRNNRIKDDEFLFNMTQQAVYQLFRRKLKKVVKDWYNFSLHNIRKTHGNYLKAMDVRAEEICLRLGHDFNTYLKHYGSATIFDRKDKVGIIKILGDLYGFK